jgi:hypothetical protein
MQNHHALIIIAAPEAGARHAGERRRIATVTVR